MAYRRSNGKAKATKIEPAVHEHFFTLPSGTSFLDINQTLSLVNRRFYRQGLVNAVQSIEVQYTPSNPEVQAHGIVVISKLPNTWVFMNAYTKAFAAWQKMNNEAIQETDSVRPRFLDFKIYGDADHHAAGFAGNLLPSSLGTTAVPGEWESSKFVVPNARNTTPAVGTDLMLTYEAIGVGPSYPGPGLSTFDAVSLVEGYASSRALPGRVDPNTPADAEDTLGVTPENWLGALFNEGITQSSDVIEDMITENNQAPYPFENAQVPGAAPGVVFTDTQYPGGANQLPEMAIHDRLLITTTTIGGSDTSIGGMFPCGLIRFDTTITGGTATLIVRTVPGPHRGYLAVPMKDM